MPIIIYFYIQNRNNIIKLLGNLMKKMSKVFIEIIMNILIDELNQFENMMRKEYMDRLKNQIEIEADARYYRFIVKLADNYRKGNVEKIRNIIDEENKAIKNDIERLGKELPKVKERKDTIYERKCYIPMLEFELCILTTSPLPNSLFLPEIFRESKIINPQILDKFTCEIESFFKIPFNFLVDADGNITHAHVTIAYLSYSPSHWNKFLKQFKKNYIKKPEVRFSYLYFLSIWFEMRPRHFLTKFPIFVNFIEKINDGCLFSKHLCIILKQAKWNVNFMFLPLDAISPSFHLKYLQLSDKNKVIVGVDANSMQNSFKSSMMKKFDMKKKLSPFNPRTESNVIEQKDSEADNDNENSADTNKQNSSESHDANNKNSNSNNSNNSNAGGGGQNKNKKNKNKNANNKNANESNASSNVNSNKNPNNNSKNTNPNANNNSNKNPNNSNKNPNNSNNKSANNSSANPNANNSNKNTNETIVVNNNNNAAAAVNDSQNRFELFKAFVVCLLAIQNSLSFDCFLEFGPDSELENSDEYFKKCDKYTQTVKFYKTSSLKDVFTLDEFDFWLKKSSRLKCGADEVEKLVTVATGFSHWIVSLFNDKKPPNPNNSSSNPNPNSNNADSSNPDNGGGEEAVAATVFENLVSIYEGVSQICPDASSLMKVDVDKIKDASIRAKFNDKKELVREKMNQNSKKYELFFTEQQKKYEQKCKEFNKNNYKSLIEKVDDILNLLSRKTNLKSENVKKGVNLKLPSEIELGQEDCFNVDPHMLRIIFYNMTQGLFAQKKGVENE